MANGTVVFQSAVTATPSAGLSVMADSVNDTDHGAGTAQYIKVMDGRTGGTIKAAVTANGLEVDVTRVQGTVQVLGSVQGVGTFQALGTFQPLAGSVHLAAGSVNAQGVIAHGAAIAGNPLLFAGFGSSGTQAAVGDGQLSRLWTDLNGRLQIRGTIDSIPSITVTSMPTVTVTGTVQTHGTSQVIGSVQGVGTFQVLGTIQSHGTNQALGTFQPLAGSVHLATPLPGGTIVAVGSAVHGAVADTRPLLISAFGSSGTQAAVDDGDAVRLWADLNGRLQVRGTIDSLPAIVITSGTVGLAGGTQHIGSVQRLTGGTLDFIGGTVNIGTLQGTIHIGSVQRIGGGTIDQLNGTVRGTVSIAGTISGGTVTALAGGFGSYFGTAFTANATLGTLIAPPASGTRWRLFDLTISASAAGTVLLQEAATAANGTVVIGPLFFAANGGMVQASARGIPARVMAQGLFCSVSVGTVAVTANYTLET